MIPISMYRSGYRPADFFVFACKRVVRLDPPYLASIALILALNLVSPHFSWYRGPPFALHLRQLLLHLAYLNVLMGVPTLNPVYWTLAIELQFYLLMAVLLPLLASGRRATWVAPVIVLAVSGLLLKRPEFLLLYVHSFLLGVLTFRWRIGGVRRVPYLLLTLLLGAGVASNLGLGAAVVAVATAWTIAFVDTPLPVLGSVGVVSYSLYLLHVPVGGRVVSLGLRFVHGAGGYLFVATMAVLASIAAGWVMYHLLERPTQRLSSRMTFESDPPIPATS